MNDCWLILDGKVHDVTHFLGSHPGGQSAIMAVAGVDATKLFHMIHSPDVLEKFAPDSVVGFIRSAPAVELAHPV